MSLDPRTLDVIEDCARRSHAGTIDFGSVVAKLAKAGVEAYHADYRSGETTYYLPSGDIHRVSLDQPAVPIAEGFDAAGVQNAVHGAQRGEVVYPDFVRLTRASGCVGYFVWIDGRHVQYQGRRGEQHIERFPD